jgi:hypothetical protein
MGENGNADILVVKPEEKRSVERTEYRWEGYIKNGRKRNRVYSCGPL